MGNMLKEEYGFSIPHQDQKLTSNLARICVSLVGPVSGLIARLSFRLILTLRRHEMPNVFGVLAVVKH